MRNGVIIALNDVELFGHIVDQARFMTFEPTTNKPVIGATVFAAMVVLFAAFGWAPAAFGFGGGGKGVEAYVAQDYDKAKAIWQKEADAGEIDAMFGMGLLYDFGRGVDPNFKQALRWYRLACDKDFEKACYNGALLEIKEATEPDAFRRAEKLLIKAANFGHASAQHRLALMYVMGEGPIEKNEADARYWLEQAELSDHEKSRELLVYVQNNGTQIAALPRAPANDGEPGVIPDQAAPQNNGPLSEAGKAAQIMKDEDDRRQEKKSLDEYRKGAKRSCPLSPDIPWWGNNAHGAIVSAVDTQFQGNWDGYYQKWSKYKQNLEKGLANGKTAKVKQFGIALKGPTLSGYISKVEKRLSVIRCLQQQESSKMPGG